MGASQMSLHFNMMQKRESMTRCDTSKFLEFQHSQKSFKSEMGKAFISFLVLFKSWPRKEKIEKETAGWDTANSDQKRGIQSPYCKEHQLHPSDISWKEPWKMAPWRRSSDLSIRGGCTFGEPLRACWSSGVLSVLWGVVLTSDKWPYKSCASQDVLILSNTFYMFRQMSKLMPQQRQQLSDLCVVEGQGSFLALCQNIHSAHCFA